MKTQDELSKEKTELTAKYGKIFELVVPLDQDDLSKTATLFLKKPDKATRSIVDTLARRDGLKAVEAGLKNMYVGGDTLNDVLSNDDALASCEESVVEALQLQKATLKKN